MKIRNGVVADSSPNRCEVLPYSGTLTFLTTKLSTVPVLNHVTTVAAMNPERWHS